MCLHWTLLPSRGLVHMICVYDTHLVRSGSLSRSQCFRPIAVTVGLFEPIVFRFETMLVPLFAISIKVHRFRCSLSTVTTCPAQRVRRKISLVASCCSTCWRNLICTFSFSFVTFLEQPCNL